jgi:DNA-directed RNA polymerase subunit E"
MVAMRTARKPFKACTNCRYLVPHDVGKCPVCGSETFTENWSGIIIVVDPEKSDIAKMLDIKVKGRFAIKIGV